MGEFFINLILFPADGSANDLKYNLSQSMEISRNVKKIINLIQIVYIK